MSSLNRKMRFGSIELSPAKVIELLSPHLTEHRIERLREVVAKRSDQIVPVLENIYDRGNVSAVMRSAEAFGFFEFHIVEYPDSKFKAANRVTAGTEKWLDIKKYQQTRTCLSELKERGYQILATHLDSASRPIDEFDLTRPTALIFGNEKDGVSSEALKLADATMIIPMMGFAQSFNISVAAALCFYHAFTHRRDRMGDKAYLEPAAQEELLANYILKSVAHPEEILRNKLEVKSV